MDTSPLPDDPLAAHFSGKRRWRRVSNPHDVTLTGPAGTFAGRALDVSPGGTLVLLTDPAFYEGDDDSLTRVQRAFPQGLEVRFPGVGVARLAEVVRITPDEDGGVSLGVRFPVPLDDAESLLLGVAAAQLDDDEATAAALPRTVRPGVPMSLLLFGGGAAIAGPRYIGEVVAGGARTLEARIPVAPDALPEVAATLGNEAFPVACLRGRQRLWEGTVRMVACAAGERSVRVRVLADEPLVRAVAKNLR